MSGRTLETQTTVGWASEIRVGTECQGEHWKHRQQLDGPVRFGQGQSVMENTGNTDNSWMGQ